MNARPALLPALLLTLAACHPSSSDRVGTAPPTLLPRLPTGQHLDPAGVVRNVGSMPLAMVAAPGGRRLVLLMNGYLEQGIQVVDRDGVVRQKLIQPAAFIGLAFSPDGRTLYASGGNQEVVYRYRWAADTAALQDSLVLAPKLPGQSGTHYPAGLAPSADGRTLYVAENLGDSLAVVDLASGRVIQRLATGPYPYTVAVAPDGTVFVSNWGASTLSVFTPAAGRQGAALSQTLVAATPIAAGRHPSALLLSADGRRLFVASGSTDRVAVVDTRARTVLGELRDPPPEGPGEGSTPNALALSADGTRLFAAEGDANAVAVFDLSANLSGVASARGDDRLAGRIPTEWFPTAVVALGDTLVVANGKGRGAGPNPDGPGLGRPYPRTSYTLGQVTGSLSIIPAARTSGGELAAYTARVASANGWTGDALSRSHRYPPFAHVIYIIRENRTYDQVLGDLPQADGDTALMLFGRAVTPNGHAIAERFGIFDRFFVNAEVSADGHNWSTAAYATDYTQKTVPTQYSGDGRSYDYEGSNRDRIPAEDVAEPASGYLWDLAERAHLTYRNFGEFTLEEGPEGGPKIWRGTKPFLAANTDTTFPWFDMGIRDQVRADIWLAQLQRWARAGQMPALQTIHLPRDHTSGGAAGSNTPKAMVADNDLALGRMIAALSRSPFWLNTVVFVLEDDAQNGPDHVDSHRSPLLVISAWNRQGVYHRFANTTDVIRTIEEILGLGSLSQFDGFGRPLREIWSDAADARPIVALTPSQPLEELNAPRGRAALESRRFDLSRADAIDDDAFSRVIWMAVKGEGVPYPGARRMSALEAVRAR